MKRQYRMIRPPQATSYSEAGGILQKVCTTTNSISTQPARNYWFTPYSRCLAKRSNLQKELAKAKGDL
eukprot:5873371-Pleurochrysis_carterae.AAC.2